jgi:hypothetical protein
MIPKNRVPKKFCDKKCSTAFRYIGKFSTLKECPFCKKIFNSHSVSRKVKNFCSSSCYGKYRFPASGNKKKSYKMICINGKYTPYHRWIMQNHIGRKLEKDEHVHHINGDHTDNRIENLQVLSSSNHMSLEIKLRINIREPF